MILLVVAGIVVFRTQSAARADTVTTSVSVSCPIVGAVTVPITATDTPDPATAGGHVTLDIVSGIPSVPIVVTINSVTLVVPAPTQVASLDSVTFTGCNLTGSYTVAADNSSVSITLTGPVRTVAAAT